MNKQKNTVKGLVACVAILLILVIDQIIKIEVKTNMSLHESIRVTGWFYINFVENNGMAYGMTFIPKIALSLFRIAAVVVIGVYIYRQVKAGARMGYVLCLAMVLAGAAGNIIDCLFYGQIFSASTLYSVASFVEWGSGYAPILQGRVVDMFYFPIIDTYLPDWLPIWGGERYIFFSPVFNFADACISVGVVMLLLFFRKELSTIGSSSKDDADIAEKGNKDNTETKNKH